MSDELIRYNRIKSFIFQPQSYLSFGTLGYNLKDNEIIVIQSILTQEYFDGLVAATINKYVKYNTYDTAEPIIHQIYENELDLDNVINPEEERDCVTELSTHIASMKWRPCFPSDFNELKYENSMEINRQKHELELISKSHIKELEECKASLSSRVSELESALNNKVTEVESLNVKISELQNGSSSVDSELQSKISELEDSQSSSQLLSSRVSELESE